MTSSLAVMVPTALSRKCVEGVWWHKPKPGVLQYTTARPPPSLLTLVVRSWQLCVSNPLRCTGPVVGCKGKCQDPISL